MSGWSRGVGSLCDLDVVCFEGVDVDDCAEEFHYLIFLVDKSSLRGFKRPGHGRIDVF